MYAKQWRFDFGIDKSKCMTLFKHFRQQMLDKTNLDITDSLDV